MADGESGAVDAEAAGGSFWRRNRVGLIAGGALLLVAVLAALLTLPGLMRGTSDPNDTSHGDRASVFAVCQDEMRARVKVPDAAVFSGIEDAQIKVDGDTWIVLSEVDASDGAGGTVHSSYRCTAVHLEGTTYQVKTTLLG